MRSTPKDTRGNTQGFSRCSTSLLRRATTSPRVVASSRPPLTRHFGYGFETTSPPEPGLRLLVSPFDGRPIRGGVGAGDDPVRELAAGYDAGVGGQRVGLRDRAVTVGLLEADGWFRCGSDEAPALRAPAKCLGNQLTARPVLTALPVLSRFVHQAVSLT